MVSSAIVTGEGSLWRGESIFVSSGTLTIAAGGRITSDFGGVGSEFGRATVTGEDSLWSTGEMAVIGGTLLIENRGRVESEPGFIVEGGQATVTGEGSFWRSGELSVGGGKLLIDAGGRVTSVNGEVGNFGGQGLATVTGQGSQWINDHELVVGKQGTGSLFIENGGQVASTTSGIGFAADAVGSAVVTGAGSTWTNSSALTVGFDGRGSLGIDNGGSVSNVASAIGWNEGSEGHAIVFGSGSIWTNSSTLLVGVRGTGFLTVGGSATLVTGMDIFSGASIGQESGSSGAVTVTDPGTTWTAAGANIIVGDSGTGVLTIENGARAVSGWGLAGLSGGGMGTVTVTGAGSLWSVENWVNFGVGGSAMILIEKGGQLITKVGHLALGQNSLAQVTVTGQNSKWTSLEDLFVGGNPTDSRGTATFTVADGGHLEVGSRLKLWDFGTLTLNGGSITTHSFDRSVGVFNHFDGVLTINGDGAGLPVFVLDNRPTTTPIEEVHIGAVNQGRLEIRNGSVLANAGDAFLGIAAGSTGSALVTNPGSAWTNGGRLVVGDAGVGVLRVESGAEVSNETGFIARKSDSTGFVEVVGAAASWTMSRSLYVGGSASDAGGAGSLLAAAGGRVSVGDRMTVWDEGKVDVQHGGTIEVATTLTNAGLIEIATGGRISAASISNTGTMTNHGTLVGDLRVGAGGELSGNGIFNGTVTIADRGMFSPGASPGFSSMSQTVWEAGGSYLWEINALSGAGGVAGQDPGWDLWDTGELTIGGPFTITLQSLTSENTAGLLAGWNPLLDQQWQIATSLNGAFSSLSLLLIDTAGFLNPLLGGGFSLSASTSGNDLYLNYSNSGEAAVPLPSNLVHLAVLGLLVCGYAARRRNSHAFCGAAGTRRRSG